MQPSTSSLADLLVPCNRTELYQICRRNGLYVLPSTSCADMIAYILETKEPPAVGHPIDAWRHGIMGVIIEHADVVQATLNCPAKTLDPLACFQCPDTQVMSCLIQNPNDEPLIATRRIVRPSYREETKDMSNPNLALTVANAPRSLEELKTKSVFRLSTLATELGSKANPQTGQPFFPPRNDTSEQAKAMWSAFATGKAEVFAPVVLAVLQQHDAVFGPPGGQPGAAPAMAQQPSFAMPAQVGMTAQMQQPVTIPTGPGQMMQQPMTQQQVPAAAAQATEGQPKRTPKTAASADNGEVLVYLKGLSEKVDNLVASINSLAQATTRLVARAEIDGARIENTESMVIGLTKGHLYALGVLLQVGEAVTQQPADELANAATSMAPIIPGLFEQVGKG
jgi:hypothetical protein